MNTQTQPKPANNAALLVKADPNSPALIVLGPDSIAIKAGTIFAGMKFEQDTPLPQPEGGLVAGADYGVVVTVTGSPGIVQLKLPPSDIHFAGFHYAPGGNAAGRSGGDGKPAINPFSLWDLNFRPTCPDPRGMALVKRSRGHVAGGLVAAEIFDLFWCDIYLLANNHLDLGTSAFGATIADGEDTPQKPGHGKFVKLDYDTALTVMKHHGKGLLSVEEFFAAAYGVTEKSSADEDPEVTKLDAPRTSKFGLMQATGSMWVWGHDGDPDVPRASLFGGSWISGGRAGSRCASLGHWPDYSDDAVGARGRSDHLQLA